MAAFIESALLVGSRQAVHSLGKKVSREEGGWVGRVGMGRTSLL